MLLLSACSWYRNVVPASSTITITVTDTANPDGNDRPSPVGIRIVELADRAVFDKNEFNVLYSDSKESALAADTLHQWQMIVRPGDTKVIDKILNEQTKYLGIVVAYRNIENARWNHLIAIDPVKKNNVRATIDALSVALTVQK